MSIEALLRWEREDRIVPATDFIPFAEASGQIRQLGLRTIELLQADLRRLDAEGWRHLPVALNVSVPQLADPGTLARLHDLLGGGCDQTIVIEVTESVFLPDNSLALQALAAIEQLGATVVVDDFGSGFSNLRLLQTLAPTQVKLDRSFVNVDRESADARVLMRSAVEMAQRHGRGGGQ